MDTEFVPGDIFKAAVGNHSQNFSLDSRMLSVLMALDGKKNLALISQELTLDMSTLSKIIKKLVEIKLITKVAPRKAALDKDFFDFLNLHLSLAIGPLAPIIIEDALHDLGHGMKFFPIHRAAELVDMISREIQREDKKIGFKRRMLSKLQEITDPESS